MLALLVLVAFTVASCGRTDQNRGSPKRRASEPWLDQRQLRRAHLAPTPPAVIAACRQIAHDASAQRVDLTVYCPPAVPDVGPYKLETAGGILRYHRFTDGYQLSFFGLSAVWAYKWGGHWSFAAGRGTSLRVFIYPPGRPIHAVRTEHVQIEHLPATVYRMSPTAPAFYAGHVVIVWRQAGKTFDVTAHGFRWESRLKTIAEALINEVRRCSVKQSRPPRCARMVFDSHP